jgi:hypothetical protein
MCVRVLCGIAKHSRSDSARVSAAALLFERGYGKAPLILGEDGEGSIQVIIRHIVESVPAPRTIDHAPLTTNNGGDQSSDDSS